MKTRFSWPPPLAVLLVVLACFIGSAQGASLQEFGFGRMQTRGEWPTLVILGNFTNTTSITNPPFSHYDIAYWQDRIFNPTPANGLSDNAYFKQASNGRFQLGQAGVIKVDLDPKFNMANLLIVYPEPSQAGLVETLHYSNIVYHAMGQFDLKPYDKNGNGVVTLDELLVLTVLNEVGAATRDAGTVTNSASAVAWSGFVAMQMDTTSMDTSCHELSHLLGAIDDYGLWGDVEQMLHQGITLMASGLTHLDPWHKMQFGWAEPVVVSMHAGGRFFLPAAALGNPAAPVLLWDPGRGPKEFFLLEYRTRQSSAGGQYEASLPNDGLAIWHIRHDAGNAPVLYPDVAYPASQPDWRICVKCRCLVYNAQAAADCAAGTSHELFTLDSRLINNVAADPGEHGWRFCHKCGQLFFGPKQATSHCPAGNQHDGSTSGDYSLKKNAPDRVGFHHWRRCLSCESLYYEPERTKSRCAAATADTFHTTGPDEYIIWARWNQLTVLSRGAGDLILGGNQLWDNNHNTTPNLVWYDGSPTSTRVHLRPFAPTDDGITVEIFSADETWVDFSYTGIELGLFDLPFNTLEEGAFFVPYGGILKIKQGHTTEVGKFSKPMSIEAYGGPVTLGR